MLARLSKAHGVYESEILERGRSAKDVMERIDTACAHGVAVGSNVHSSRRSEGSEGASVANSKVGAGAPPQL